MVQCSPRQRPQSWLSHESCSLPAPQGFAEKLNPEPREGMVLVVFFQACSVIEASSQCLSRESVK